MLSKIDYHLFLEKGAGQRRLFGSPPSRALCRVSGIYSAEIRAGIPYRRCERSSSSLLFLGRRLLWAMSRTAAVSCVCHSACASILRRLLFSDSLPLFVTWPTRSDLHGERFASQQNGCSLGFFLNWSSFCCPCLCIQH